MLNPRSALVVAFGLLLVGTLAVAVGWAHWPGSRLPDRTTVDRVVVIKHARRMILLSGGSVIREYRVSLGANPLGHKRFEGDERTPEGLYVLDWKNAQSIAHLSVHVSYPDAADRRAAELSGRDPGGMIMVHGIRNGLGWIGRMHRFWDWTDGCIALTDPEMDEFFRVVPTGTPIEIRP